MKTCRQCRIAGETRWRRVRFADGSHMQKSLLLADENVAAYLGPAEADQNDLVQDEAPNEADDFS